MADYGNYTTYHFDDVDEMSDYESTGAPPPPPPEDDYDNNKNTGRAVDSLPKDLEGGGENEYEVNNTTIETMADEEDGIAEDESVEIPPTKVVEEMMRRESEAQTDKRGSKTILCSAILCILVSLAVVLGAGFGTGAFDMSRSESSASAANAPSVGSDQEVETKAPEPEGEERPGEEATDTVENTVRGQDMRAYLSSISLGGADTFADLSSPESLALQWLVLEDPLKLDATNPDHQFQITQRYALVTLWYNSDFTWANETNWLNEDECSWHGVSCVSLTSPASVSKSLDNSTTEASTSTGLDVVTGINLEGNNVQGNIPQDLALLSFVTQLNLADNLLQGSIPASLTRMISLEQLFLDRNLFNTDLSSYDFSGFVSLQMLDLSTNQFTGTLPTSLWTLSNLELLVLDNNGFTGTLSENIGKLTKLTRFTVGNNKLSGTVPEAIANLENLQVIWLFKNQFSGSLMDSWPASLIVLDLYANELTGEIPATISNLGNIQQLVLGANQFSGPLPESIGDMTQLTVLNIEDCELEGAILPESFANLANLTIIRLGNNPNVDSDDLPDFIFEEWTALEELRLPGVQLTGNLTGRDWASLPELRLVDLSNNFLEGFPEEITVCEKLEELNLSDNNDLGGMIGSGGIIPDDFDSLVNLRQLQLANTGLMGNLTSAVGNMESLEILDLTNNTFMGPLPDLSGVPNAKELKFGTNFFIGTIPDSVGQLTALEVLDLSVNFLRGTIPASLSNVATLTVLKLGDNANEQPFSGFFGELPGGLANCRDLVSMEFFSNRFTGTLPPEWGVLDKLELLDIEFNAVSGQIPNEYSGMASLTEFYASNTDLSGSVPTEVCSVSPDFFVVDCDVECSCCSRCEDGSGNATRVR